MGTRSYARGSNKKNNSKSGAGKIPQAQSVVAHQEDSVFDYFNGIASSPEAAAAGTVMNKLLNSFITANASSFSMALATAKPVIPAIPGYAIQLTNITNLERVLCIYASAAPIPGVTQVSFTVILFSLKNTVHSLFSGVIDDITYKASAANLTISDVQIMLQGTLNTAMSAVIDSQGPYSPVNITNIQCRIGDVQFEHAPFPSPYVTRVQLEDLINSTYNNELLAYINQAINKNYRP